MKRAFVLTPLVLASAAVLAACTQPRTAANPQPVTDGSAELDARLRADSTLSPDSAAQWILAGCKGSRGSRLPCTERALYAVLEGSGVSRAMAALDRMADADADLRREAHGLAHGLGIAAYRSPETVAATFAACPNTQISGCYHGVLQGYFLDMARHGVPITGERLNAVCEPHRSNGMLYGQCSHGLGHGLMAVMQHRLPPTLAACDSLTDGSAREGCYGGAFMENIVAVTHPDHTAESHAATHGGMEGEHAGMDHGDGHGDAHAEHDGTAVASAGAEHAEHAEGAGEHAGMDHGAMSGEHAGMDHGAMAGHAGMSHGASDAPAEEWKPLDSADPLYPCTAVAEKYHYQCYLIQTAAILPSVNGDVARTAQICARAPGRMVAVCYASLGRDITSYAARDPRGVAALCARTGEAAEAACVRGAAVSLVDVAANPADGLALCRIVQGEAVRAACWTGVGGTLPINTPDMARREAVCAEAPAEFLQGCRAAAGLPRKES